MSRTTLLLLPAAVLAGVALGYLARGGGGEPGADRAPELRGETDDRTPALTRRIRELEVENADLRARLREEAPAVEPPFESAAPVQDESAPTDDEARAAALAGLPALEYHLSANPSARDLLRRYVRAAARAGENDRSLALLARLAKENPENPDIHVQTGRALLYKASTVEVPMEKGAYAFKAIERFDGALVLDERHFDARLARAVSLYHFPTFLNKLDQSISDFEVLVSQEGGRGGDDRYARAYAGLAAAYRKAGRAEDAKKALDKGLALFPGDPALTR